MDLVPLRLDPSPTVFHGVRGAICGFAVGAVCALIAAWWARSGSQGSGLRYAVLAGVVSIVLCSAFSLFVLVPSPDPVADLAMRWLLPTVVAGTAAAGLGALVWKLGAPRPIRPL